jgi:phosphopantothenoylcysteine decarboxylase/phosphopantothenate--cysteine ligase
MATAVRDALATADVLVMAAAPADFRAAQAAPQKIKKGASAPVIALEHTDDILQATRGARRPGAVMVGFALETEQVEAHATAKLESKGLDLIVANLAGDDSGFGHDTNRVTIFARGGGREDLPLMGKAEVADAILDRVAGLV